MKEMFTAYELLAKLEKKSLRQTVATNLSLREIRKHINLGAFAHNFFRRWDPCDTPRHWAVFNKALFERRLKLDKNSTLVLDQVDRMSARSLTAILERAAEAGASVIVTGKNSRRVEFLRRQLTTHEKTLDADRAKERSEEREI